MFKHSYRNQSFGGPPHVSFPSHCALGMMHSLLPLNYSEKSGSEIKTTVSTSYLNFVPHPIHPNGHLC
ncbi:hypothetical protein A0H81_09318 [Grifola frondosa]|uniref:Uncharacterized protein n=1 Tax=Grifola frondosa TaxID=5627 RepID=A0A1C7M166_GRIFR|nr:hypothetical protein A0H81_09318 [Grifola frondosa]